MQNNQVSVNQNNQTIMTTIEARICLNSVRLRLGRNYKSAIRQAWEDGNYNRQCLGDFSSTLQRIRNQFGPSWLIRAKPATPDQDPHFVPAPSCLGTSDSAPYVL